jgi:hypothetical protein
MIGVGQPVVERQIGAVLSGHIKKGPSPLLASDHALDHNDEQDAALVPTTQPADLPAINAIAKLDCPEKPQELRFNVHSPLRTCMALQSREVNAKLQREALFASDSSSVNRTRPSVNRTRLRYGHDLWPNNPSSFLPVMTGVTPRRARR